MYPAPPCRPGVFFSVSSRGLTTGSRLWDLSQRDPYRIHWIATVALLPRDDKKCITLTLSCHCEPSQMAWQSSQLTCRAVTPRPLVIPWLSFLCHPGARGPLSCHPGAFFSVSSRGLTTGSRLWDLSQRDPYRIHWIAAVALLPRDDKIYHPLSLRA